MESGDIELRGEAGRSNSCCMAFFRVSSKVGGGGGFFSFLFSTSWMFIHFVAGIYCTTFFVIV